MMNERQIGAGASLPARNVCVVVGAAMIVGGAVGLTVISARFVWGEGHDDRPIWTLLVLLLTMGVGFLLSSGMATWRRWTIPAWFIIAVGWAARLALAPSDLIQESDCYRYVLDGMCVTHGVNPFRHRPAHVIDEAEGALGESLQSKDARQVVKRVSYPELRTIYPPLAQACFVVGAVATPWNWRGQRVVFLVCDIATMLLLVWGLQWLGRPVVWATFYAWNPLILKEVANSAHLDSLAGLCIVALCLVLIAVARRPSKRLSALVGVLFACAVMSKLYPLILGPVCLAAVARGKGGRERGAVFVLVGGVAMAASLAPFMAVGWENLTEGLRAYNAEWVRNDGAFALLDRFTPWARGAHSLITIAAACIGAVCVFFARRDVAATVIAAFQATLLLWFLFLPAAFPWYAIGLLAVCALGPTLWAYVLSVVFCLYYLLFLFEYRESPASWETAMVSVEHGVVWVAIVVSGALAVVRRRPRDENGSLEDWGL